MACRQFNVFDKVCEIGEYAFHPRPGVMQPIRRYADDAFYRMLPFFGVKQDAVKSGRIHAFAMGLQMDWSELADRMERGQAGRNSLT